MGKKRKRHVLTLPKTKFHAKNQKNLSRGFPGKLSERERERDRETERQTERDGPEYKGPPDAIAKPSDQKVCIFTNFFHKEKYFCQFL